MPKVENEVIVIDGLLKVKKNSVIATFSDNKKIQPYIDKVRKAVSVESFTVTTQKGRDDIKSRAFKVAKLKTALIKEAIDPSVAEYKAAVKLVGSGKKFFTESMDELRDQIRAPLNDWEEAEKVKEMQRVRAIKEKITGIIELGNPRSPDENVNQKDHITQMLDAIDSIDCSEGFEEFAQEAMQELAKSKQILSDALNSLIQKELEEKNRKELLEAQAKLNEEKAELDRQNLAKDRLNKLKMIPLGLIGMPSIDIQRRIESLQKFEVPEAEFGELHAEASEAVEVVIASLQAMFTQQQMVEAAAPMCSTALQQEPEATPEQFDQEMASDPHDELNGMQITHAFIDEADQPNETTAFNLRGVLMDWANRSGINPECYDELILILNKYEV